MPDDKAPEHTNDPAAPSSVGAPPLTDAEANRQMGQGEAPQGTPAVSEAAHEPDRGAQQPDTSAPGDPQSVKVGARDVVRPTGDLDASESGEGSVYDRLAKKDGTSAGPGGDVGVA